ncbi:Methyltransferase-like protein 13 [Tetrabaena socialis]|uniref:Methyltransferase-like protein 13 n=1 Tax=Tetrabaena socialis TaxID=47790 RepID=A0A2J8AG61_9CHLO|nr:Methyltransferase-like protein 13 [Tetrabaena socialis]|eukprot:PNH11513.1 Methyltransferase-like protein 13 [Tetrabaena socialis]
MRLGMTHGKNVVKNGGGGCKAPLCIMTLPSVALRLANVRYADKEYWENRYHTQSCQFDWFFGYTALRKIVRAYVKRSRLVLHVGCGNSNFSEGLAADSYQVVNTDISEVVVQQMRQRHAALSSLRYVVSDCRRMPEFLDCQFGSVIDKGTVDALLCSKEAEADLSAMFREVSRVLAPGGVFLLVTLGGPAQRLQLVNRAEFGWTVQVLLVRRVPEGQLAPSDPGRAIPLNDTLRSLPVIGPLDVQPDGSLGGLPEPFEPSSYFFAYACRKAPLALRRDDSGSGDTTARLPEGWRTAVRAVAGALSEELQLPKDILGRGRRIKVTSRRAFERQLREREEEEERALDARQAAFLQQQQQQQGEEEARGREEEAQGAASDASEGEPPEPPGPGWLGRDEQGGDGMAAGPATLASPTGPPSPEVGEMAERARSSCQGLTQMVQLTARTAAGGSAAQQPCHGSVIASVRHQLAQLSPALAVSDAGFGSLVVASDDVPIGASMD